MTIAGRLPPKVEALEAFMQGILRSEGVQV